MLKGSLIRHQDLRFLSYKVGMFDILHFKTLEYIEGYSILAHSRSQRPPRLLPLYF